MAVSKLLDAFWVAASCTTVPVSARWRYFCGVCWRRIGELSDAAAAILTAEDADGGAP